MMSDAKEEAHNDAGSRLALDRDGDLRVEHEPADLKVGRQGDDIRQVSKRSDDTPPGEGPVVDVVRLSVNLSVESAEVFKGLCARRRISFTEGIRRAIRVWQIVEAAHDDGARVLIESGSGRNREQKELVLL